MTIAGIIAEYDPLHNGHALHIKKTREQTGCDYIVAAMSGSFVQRGEPAAYSKFDRARWALEAGVDIVLELPVIYSMQSAERFAMGGVLTLKSAGAGVLSFGSECACVDLANRAAELISAENGAFAELLRAELNSGKTYARALTNAADKAGESELARLLKLPNFMLSAQYAAGVKKYAPDMRLCAIERRGARHGDLTAGGEFSSASAIRRAVSQGRAELAKEAVAPDVYEAIRKKTPATLNGLEKCILYKLRTTGAARLGKICGVNEGMENLMLRGALKNSLDELLGCVKSKRYTMARVKRALCCALLNIDAELAAQKPAYLRVLAMKKIAAPLLKRFELPIVCKKADMSCLPENAKAMLEKDILAADLREIACSGEEFMRDMTQKLIVF